MGGKGLATDVLSVRFPFWAVPLCFPARALILSLPWSRQLR